MPTRAPIGYVPLRGTQSFVGVMSHIWNRPSLSGLEIAWRWLVGSLILLFTVPLLLGTFGMDIHLNGAPNTGIAVSSLSLQSLTVFQPVAAIQILTATVAAVLNPSLPFLRWIIPAVLLLWLLLSTLGRTLVLRHFDPTLHPRRVTLLALTTLRIFALAAAWSLWIATLLYATRTAITHPAARGEEPSLVLFSAIVIVATLALYVLWAAVSWPLHLAPLLAMRNNTGILASLRKAVAAPRDLRSKLIETNLVMCIVRLALIILAMVLSASPLAFQTVATQQFFVIWWCIAVLLYFASSDYFHVVRSAAYLTLLRAYVYSPLD